MQSKNNAHRMTTVMHVSQCHNTACLLPFCMSCKRIVLLIPVKLYFQFKQEVGMRELSITVIIKLNGQFNNLF